MSRWVGWASCLWIVATISGLMACRGTPAAPAPTTPTRPTVSPGLPAATVDPLDQPTPLRADVRTGRLANGLRYFILRNEVPATRAALRLVINAGSVQEDDDQRGLAHVVEHMAFNGTAKYPKHAIIETMARLGMQFGPHVNAYTSFDETVYMLEVPTDSDAGLTTGLDVLREWASAISFEPTEIDKERGVVLEEWRLSRGGDERVFAQLFPLQVAGSKYAQRLPIGLPAIITGAPAAALTRYYRDWYRPDNMVIIAVGDFDAEQVEAAVRTAFTGLVNPPTPRPRVDEPVPHDQPSIVGVATDSELSGARIQLLHKRAKPGERTRRDYRRFLVDELATAMLTRRLLEASNPPASPFTVGYASADDLGRVSQGLEVFAEAKPKRAHEALTVVTTELQRLALHGFTAGELARAITQHARGLEQAATEGDKLEAGELADELVRHALEGEQMPGRAGELEMVRTFAPGITLAEVNAVFASMLAERGNVVTVALPASDPALSEADLRTVLATARAHRAETLAPYQEPAIPQTLLALVPTPGKVVRETADAATGVVRWELANGARVVLKPTAFQNDDVQFAAISAGGASVVAPRAQAAIKALARVANAGAGSVDEAGVERWRDGKQVDLFAYVGDHAEGLRGNASQQEVGALLEWAHGLMAPQQLDADALASWRDTTLDDLAARGNRPDDVFADAFVAHLTGRHARRRPLTPAQVRAVTLPALTALHQARFGDAAEFTFVLTGNVDPVVVRPLVERYLGSLPGKPGLARERAKTLGIRWRQGPARLDVRAGVEPQASVSMQLSLPTPWTRARAIDGELLARVLDLRLLEVLREDLSGVYGVDAAIYLARTPGAREAIGIEFGCAPENVDRLIAAAKATVAEVAAGPVEPRHLEAVREQLTREHESALRRNGWWLDVLASDALYTGELAASLDLTLVLKRLTPAQLQATARALFGRDRWVIGVRLPSADPAAAAATNAATK